MYTHTQTNTHAKYNNTGATKQAFPTMRRGAATYRWIEACRGLAGSKVTLFKDMRCRKQVLPQDASGCPQNVPQDASECIRIPQDVSECPLPIRPHYV